MTYLFQLQPSNNQKTQIEIEIYSEFYNQNRNNRIKSSGISRTKIKNSEHINSVVKLKGSYKVNFDTEKDLQNYCLAILKTKGIRAKEEVWANGLRADIVTDKAVIELKKVLTRDSIFQARGQGVSYQARLNKSELWIVGMSPKNPRQLEAALNTAKQLAKEGVRVSFIDQDSYWWMNSENASTPLWQYIAFIIGIIIVGKTLALSNWNTPEVLQAPRVCDVYTDSYECHRQSDPSMVHDIRP